MAILREAIHKDGKNAILIALASICVGVWIVGLGLLCGVVGSLKSPDLYQLAQLSQLGIEIDTFDSANKVSFHHKADHLADGCVPSVVAASAISH